MLPEIDRVSAGFLVKNKKVFVAQRNKNDDLALKWEFPGGKCIDEEKHDDALVREFKEEFQIDIEVLKEIGGAETVHKNKPIVIVFLLIDGDESKIKLIQHNDSKFVNLAELKSLDLCEADRSFVSNYETELKEYIS